MIREPSRTEVAARGALATETALVEARKTATRDRPARDTINASLVLTPAEYEQIRDKAAWHQGDKVALGEPAVIDGYLVWDDFRIPAPSNDTEAA